MFGKHALKTKTRPYSLAKLMRAKYALSFWDGLFPTTWAGPIGLRLKNKHIDWLEAQPNLVFVRSRANLTNFFFFFFFNKTSKLSKKNRAWVGPSYFASGLT